MQLEETLITYGAPTLAGIKLANLFRYHAPPGLNLLPEIETTDRRLRPLGIRLCILKHCQRTGSHLLYLYREQALHCRLNRPEIRRFLQQCGYSPASGSGALLEQLSGRLCLSAEFPHEIGVFLGYPMQDVVGFIQNGGRRYHCAGCWKVYGNVPAAKRCFAQYAACTRIYCSRFSSGSTLLQLAVPSHSISTMTERM